LAFIIMLTKNDYDDRTEKDLCTSLTRSIQKLNNALFAFFYISKRPPSIDESNAFDKS